ncbi:MAG: glycoside hydrolase family 31 protein [Bacteroidetes bacterium]|nr:MAG: glycoside hydrolase family 31 protein [Bacteroidota bacterium]
MRQLFLLALLGITTSLHGQLLTVRPAQPTADDTVTIIFNAREGNGVLAGYKEAVYAHTGVIIGTPDEPSGWRYVQGNWGQDDARMKMTPLGEDLYQFKLHIRSFYGIPEDEPFLQLALVFRNRNGSLVAKDTGEADIYYPQIEVFEHGPLEKADGRDGTFMGDVADIFTLPDGSIVLSDSQQRLRLQYFEEGLVNLTYLPVPGTEAPESEAVIAFPEYWLDSTSALFHGNQTTYLPLGEGVFLQVQQNPLRWAIRRGDSLLLESEEGFFFDPGDPMIGPVSGLRLRLQPGERLYGTGSRALPLDRRGHRLYAYNTASYGYTWGEEDLNISIPYLLSSRGYALFFDTYRRGYFDLGHTESDILEFGAKDSVLSVYILLGKSGKPDEIQRDYTWLTGTQPMPPIWALGYIQSRYGYKSQAELERITQQTLDAGYPLDAVLLDLYWFGGLARMGDLDWDSEQFPDPDGMMRWLDEKQVQTLLITETYFVEGTRHMQALEEKGLLTRDPDGKSFIIPDFWAGPAGLLDVFQPGVAEWLWPFYQAQLDRGADGFWCDSGEPENHPKKMRHRPGPAEQVHNLYGSYWAQHLYEQHARQNPGRRFFNLIRSGYAGMQRYATFPWSGDVSRSWDAYRAQAPIMLGAGLCGIPYMHADLGGFTGGPKDEELYRRWVQMGTFVPIMRIHGDAEGIEPEPIFYSEVTQDIVREAIKLRYRLLPYTYTLAWEQMTDGHPLARPLFYHYPADDRVQGRYDSYLWGRDLLVAPIWERGATQRQVHLPEGRWYDFYSGQPLAGGQTHTVAVAAEHIPVFVRGGSILPRSARDLPNTQAYRGDSLHLSVFPGPRGTIARGKVYQDDGATAGAYETGAYRLLSLEGQWQKKQYVLSIKAEGQGFNGLPEALSLTWTLYDLVGQPVRVRWNGKKLDAEAWIYDPNGKTLTVITQSASAPGKLEVKVKP